MNPLKIVGGKKSEVEEMSRNTIKQFGLLPLNTVWEMFDSPSMLRITYGHLRDGYVNRLEEMEGDIRHFFGQYFGFIVVRVHKFLFDGNVWEKFCPTEIEA